MGKIVSLDEIRWNFSEKLCHQEKRIGKWWGKTYYYYDKNDHSLKYRSFSLIGRLLHYFGYKKEYHQSDLGKWLTRYNIGQVNVKEPNPASLSIKSSKSLLKAVVSARSLMKRGDCSETQTKVANIFRNQPEITNCRFDDSGLTPLILACRQNLPEVAEKLIENGADVNACLQKSESYSRTPLQYAVHYRNVKLVELLLGKGARVDEKNSEGCPTLLWAVMHTLQQHKIDDSKKIVRLILDKKPNVNAECKDGSTPLHAACESKDLEVIKWLLESGADPSKKDAEGKLPSDLVKGPHAQDILEILKAVKNENSSETVVEETATINTPQSQDSKNLENSSEAINLVPPPFVVPIQKGLKSFESDLNADRDSSREPADSSFESLIEQPPLEQHEELPEGQELSLEHFEEQSEVDSTKQDEEPLSEEREGLPEGQELSLEHHDELSEVDSAEQDNELLSEADERLSEEQVEILDGKLPEVSTSTFSIPPYTPTAESYLVQFAHRMFLAVLNSADFEEKFEKQDQDVDNLLNQFHVLKLMIAPEVDDNFVRLMRDPKTSDKIFELFKNHLLYGLMLKTISEPMDFLAVSICFVESFNSTYFVEMVRGIFNKMEAKKPLNVLANENLEVKPVLERLFVLLDSDDNQDLYNFFFDLTSVEKCLSAIENNQKVKAAISSIIEPFMALVKQNFNKVER